MSERHNYSIVWVIFLVLSKSGRLYLEVYLRERIPVSQHNWSIDWPGFHPVGLLRIGRLMTRIRGQLWDWLETKVSWSNKDNWSIDLAPGDWPIRWLPIKDMNTSLRSSWLGHEERHNRYRSVLPIGWLFTLRYLCRSTKAISLSREINYTLPIN